MEGRRIETKVKKAYAEKNAHILGRPKFMLTHQPRALTRRPTGESNFIYPSHAVIAPLANLKWLPHL